MSLNSVQSSHSRFPIYLGRQLKAHLHRRFRRGDFARRRDFNLKSLMEIALSIYTYLKSLGQEFILKTNNCCFGSIEAICGPSEAQVRLFDERRIVYQSGMSLKLPDNCRTIVQRVNKYTNLMELFYSR